MGNCIRCGKKLPWGKFLCLWCKLEESFQKMVEDGEIFIYSSLSGFLRRLTKRQQ